MIKDMKCIDCGTDIPSSTDHSSDEPYMFVCNDCRDEIGNGGGYDPNGLPKDFTDRYHDDEPTEEEQERANHIAKSQDRGEM